MVECRRTQSKDCSSLIRYITYMGRIIQQDDRSHDTKGCRFDIGQQEYLIDILSQSNSKEKSKIKTELLLQIWIIIRIGKSWAKNCKGILNHPLRLTISKHKRGHKHSFQKRVIEHQVHQHWNLFILNSVQAMRLKIFKSLAYFIVCLLWELLIVMLQVQSYWICCPLNTCLSENCATCPNLTWENFLKKT